MSASKGVMLQGKSAIVTGASRGIGREIALAFAENGADLIINGTDDAKLESLKTEVLTRGVRCAYKAGDVGLPETAEALSRLCIDRFGKIDILVNNAGINSRVPFLELSNDEWKRMFAVNTDSVFYLCKAVLPYMIQAGSGCIINISSTASKTAHPTASISYGASKAAVNSMTQKLAFEMGEHHIRVNGICPGPILTDMSSQWTDEYRAAVVKKIPLGVIGSAKNVADVAVFLSSDMAAFINGETINVNGGSYMN